MVDLTPILNWFEGKGWEPFDFQHEVWAAYLNGESGLIHAPTGTGKTYAAWMGALAEWLAEHPDAPAKDVKRNQTPPLRVLWLTPLRALASDTAQALQETLDAVNVPWSLETRTGDTSSTVRGRQRKRLPTALITTPESLSILLARADAESLFGDLRLVVVDEWHELMASKRGVQTELALARLRRWQPTLRTWGLSATMGNIDTALRVLLGVADYHTGEIPEGRLVRGLLPKAVTIDSIIPNEIERFPWAGHLGLKLLPDVLDIVEQSQSTLIFTNTRFQTEKWYQAILEARPDWAGVIALHHGSLGREMRDWVEDALRDGRLRCVVATSSLDLGVDFTPVDRVLQIGSPKGIARLLQRAGRSGHQPGAESRVTCVPAHALELIETAAARASLAQGIIEDRPPIEDALDVLSQHVVTVALGGGFEPDALYREVRTAYAYKDLSPEEWAWTLDFVEKGGRALHNYPQFRRIAADNGHYSVEDEQIARLHRMSIGTIVGDATLEVRFLKGKRIGRIDEGFISRLRPGERFTLAGRVLELVSIRDMTVWVRLADSQQGVIPRWVGGKLPLSEELTEAVRAQLDAARAGVYVSPEMQAVRPLLDLQAEWSAIPGEGELLIERVKTRSGHHLFFYPFGGRLVHEGLAALFAYRISRIEPITFALSSNDYGFELLSPDPAPLDTALGAGLLSADGLADDIIASLNASEMAKRQFREIARIAGLVLPRYPGGQKTARQLQVSSSLIFEVLDDYDPDNLLLEQARREVLTRQLEGTRLRRTLARLAASEVLLREPPRLTPFGFPLMVERIRGTVSSETLRERIQRMTRGLERSADA